MVSKDDPKDETPNRPDKKSSHEDNGRQRQPTRKSSSAASTETNRSTKSAAHFISPLVPTVKQVRKKTRRVTVDTRKPSGPRDVEGVSHDRTEFNPIDTVRKEVKIEIALAKPKTENATPKKIPQRQLNQISPEPLQQIPLRSPDQISPDPIQQIPLAPEQISPEPLVRIPPRLPEQISPEPIQQTSPQQFGQPKPIQQTQLERPPVPPPQQLPQQLPPQHPQQLPSQHQDAKDKHTEQATPLNKYSQVPPHHQPPKVSVQHQPVQQAPEPNQQQVLPKEPQSPKAVVPKKNQVTPVNDVHNEPTQLEAGDSQQPATIVVHPPKRKSIPPVPGIQPKEPDESQEIPTVVVYSPKPLKPKTSKSSLKSYNPNQPAGDSQAVNQPKPRRQVVINTPLQKQEIDGPNYHATHYGPKSIANHIKFDFTVAKTPHGTAAPPPVPPPPEPPKPPETVVVYRKPPIVPPAKKRHTSVDEDKLNRTKSRNMLANYLTEFSKRAEMDPQEEFNDGLDEKTNALEALKSFGIPDQSEALESLLDKDTVHFDFGGLMRQYYSYVLKSYCLINMHERYRGSSKFSNCFTAIDIAKVGTRDEEMEKYTKAKLRRLDDKREQLRQVAIDEDHYNYLKNLANNQATLLPLTIVQLINEQMAPVLEDIFRFYGKNLGTDHTCTKVAGFHYVRIRKRVSMYNNICGGSTLLEDLTPYYTK